ncbi:MAG: hypothetical protein ACYC1A_02035, partial [Spirochaetales bacterium]
MGRKTIAAWPAADYVRGLTRLILYAIRRKAPPVWVALGAVLAFYGFSARPRAILFASIALAGISTTFRLRGSALSRDLAQVGILLS